MRLFRVFLWLSLTMSTSAFAASDGGGYGGGGLTPVPEPRTPEEMAINEYNDGVKQRDKALEYEQQAKTLEEGKKKDRLLKKARKFYTKAIAKFEKAVEYNPQMYQAWSALGHALRKTGVYRRSLAAYNESLTINPDYHEAIEYQAEAHMQLHNYTSVKAAYVRLKEEHPEYAGRLLQAIHEWLPTQDPNNHSQLQTFAEWVEQQE